ncbi:WD40-like Beta Propeller Repeat [Flexibacter flexilis DSM 6793]|uniref:WD40-like Beta Propeller Repeat n=1 Tax=Flexibacter flexilis DSM 6793 TaxID=927664 RepID=A0A1I1D905_9BACT|nr:OmpA family protein [Flexibacter flexilis]SFB70862.1 WD40-like Beta Propeller Repeat [Flexibacter flexilis DSM 6793]
MSKKYLFLTFFLSLSLFGAVYAQNDKIKEAEDLILDGEEIFKFGAKRQALDMYKSAATLNPNSLKANYMTGICYLQTLNKNLALTYLLKAYELNPKYVSELSLGSELYPDQIFLIARAYHYGENFDKAIEYYELFRQNLETNQISAVARAEKKEAMRSIERKIEECKVGKEMIKHVANVSITSIAELNSEFPDYSPTINAAEDMMVFTSKRQFGMSPLVDNDLYFYEDIYVSYKKDGVWGTPELIPGINTVFNESNVGLSPDGKTMFLYKDDNNGDIFITKRQNDGSWSRPQSISENINTSDYKESSASISPDGKFLYFVSNREGGFGGSDIYVSRALSNGKWGSPQNLGNIINSPFDEESPVVSFDSKHLYFSSRGHHGMGGSDIYKADFDPEKAEWINPTNLGYPINTADDDGYYIQSSDSVRAYYASVRERGGQGDLDIFVIAPAVEDTLLAKKTEIVPETAKAVEPTPIQTIAEDTAMAANDPDPTKATKRKTTEEPTDSVPKNGESPVITLNVIVRNKNTGELMDAEVAITEGANAEGGETKRTAKGKYARDVTEEEGRHFKITIQKPDFNFEDIDVELPEFVSGKKLTFTKEIELTPAAVNVAVRLRNVYFDFAKNQLNVKKSERELGLLVNFMKDNPSVILEIAGHTDSKGKADYNLILSQRRAESIVGYLRKQGIDPSRLRPKGYGERRPLASNDDEAEGRELNRRTEFIIISKKVNRTR